MSLDEREKCRERKEERAGFEELLTCRNRERKGRSGSCFVFGALVREREREDWLERF